MININTNFKNKTLLILGYIIELFIDLFLVQDNLIRLFDYN